MPSDPLEFDITVSDRQRRFRVHQVVKNDVLVRMHMDLSLADAVQILGLLHARVDPLVAWKRHPLYQWAQKKTGQTLEWPPC